LGGKEKDGTCKKERTGKMGAIPQAPICAKEEKGDGEMVSELNGLFCWRKKEKPGVKRKRRMQVIFLGS